MNDDAHDDCDADDVDGGEGNGDDDSDGGGGEGDDDDDGGGGDDDDDGGGGDDDDDGCSLRADGGKRRAPVPPSFACSSHAKITSM